jgi:hypothetical protein
MRLKIAAMLAITTGVAIAELPPIPAEITSVPVWSGTQQEQENAFKAFYEYWKREFDDAFIARQVRVAELDIQIQDATRTGGLTQEASQALLDEWEELQNDINWYKFRKRGFVRICERESLRRFAKTCSQLGLFPGYLDVAAVLYLAPEVIEQDGWISFAGSLIAGQVPLIIQVGTTVASAPLSAAAAAGPAIQEQFQLMQELEDKFREDLRGIDMNDRSVAIVGGPGSDRAEVQEALQRIQTQVPGQSIGDYDGRAEHVAFLEWLDGRLASLMSLEQVDGGDNNKDTVVDMTDYDMFAPLNTDTTGMGDIERWEKGDYNRDGVVNFTDWLQLSTHWSPTAPPLPPPPQ